MRSAYKNIYNEAFRKAREEEYELARRREETLDLAFGIAKKLLRFLPEGWSLNYQYSTLFIRKGSESDAPGANDSLEFRAICDHLARITGMKGSRRYDNSSEKGMLIASFCKWGTKHYDIKVMLGSPNCKVEYRTEWTIPEQRTVAVVPKECLGITEEASNE